MKVQDCPRCAAPLPRDEVVVACPLCGEVIVPSTWEAVPAGGGSVPIVFFGGIALVIVFAWGLGLRDTLVALDDLQRPVDRAELVGDEVRTPLGKPAVAWVGWVTSGKGTEPDVVCEDSHGDVLPFEPAIDDVVAELDDVGLRGGKERYLDLGPPRTSDAIPIPCMGDELVYHEVSVRSGTEVEIREGLVSVRGRDAIARAVADMRLFLARFLLAVAGILAVVAGAVHLLDRIE